MADGWEDVNDPAEIRKVLGAKTVDARNKVGGGKQSVQAQNFLNTLSQQAADAAETGVIYKRSQQDINKLNPGPNRGRFLEMATPEEGGGMLDTLGAALIGGPARLIGAITPQETDAYQRLRALQSEQVLGKQLLQKGPQTESDAARLQLTEISPSKSKAVNQSVIDSGLAKTQRVQAKSIFYTKFANRWGLNGVAPNGMTADQLWNHTRDKITSDLAASRRGGSGIKVISRTKVK